VSEALEIASEILQEAVGARLHRDQPLAPFTTFRIGGPAALFLEPEEETDLITAGRAIVASGIPFAVLGKGSNVLVSDRGFPGLVLRLGRGFRWATRERDHLVAGAAMPLPALSGVALRHGLAGLEFGVAIPGTLGGAVHMNAGAHGREMAGLVESIALVRLRTGSVDRIGGSEAGFTYRRSDLGEDAVVTAATLRLVPAPADRIRAAMDEAREWRRATQPLAEANCGSVFKNPPGETAARLIDRAGAKGMRVGGASVSMKHANFVVADPGTRADDVLALIERVRSRVREASGVDLETEVHLLGVFDRAA
jgi:UDP-N-acetylmuramate dehydrogenase